MREVIRDIDRLQHIDDCIEHINDYLSGKSFEDMKADIMCYHAVVYNIMIIGEAANLLTYNEKTYPVTCIGSAAFYGCTGLTSITIPNSVTFLY
jgi:hypothetical protein